MTINPRRRLALAVATLAVLAPVLSSCGFHYATDRPNVIANGGYAIHGNIKVLAARIVATAPGTGAFVATIANRPQASSDVTLQNLSAPGLTASGFAPIKVGIGSAVNLADGQGISVTGDFAAGDSVPVTLTFSNGSVVELSTIVVTACHEYASAVPSAAASASASATPSKPAMPSSTSSAYSCAYPSLPPVTK